jgi:cytochrome c biogenesis factor
MNIGTQSIPSTIDLAITGNVLSAPPVAKAQLLVVEASVKPFMSVVWTGAVFILFGLIVSLTTKFNGKGRQQS